MSTGTKNFSPLKSKTGGDIGVRKKIFPTPSLESQTYDFRNFLRTGLKLNYLKTLKD